MSSSRPTDDAAFRGFVANTRRALGAGFELTGRAGDAVRARANRRRSQEDVGASPASEPHSQDRLEASFERRPTTPPRRSLDSHSSSSPVLAPISPAQRAIAQTVARPQSSGHPQNARWSASSFGQDTSRWSSSSGGTSVPAGPRTLPDDVAIDMQVWNRNRDIFVADTDNTTLHSYGASDCNIVAVAAGRNPQTGIYRRRAVIHLAGGAWDESFIRELNRQVFQGEPGMLVFAPGNNPSLVDSDCARFLQQLPRNVTFRDDRSAHGARGDVSLTPQGDVSVR